MKLKLSPHTGIAGHTVNFIALDGSVPLSLQVADATVDATTGTLSWTVTSQPWQSGDKLMLRVLTATPSARPTPTPAATHTPTPTHTPTATPTPMATPPVPTTTGTDRTALVAFYDATDGPNWANNRNWLSDRPLGEWHGVATDRDGRVTELDLSENELSGPILAELGSLANLRALDLRFNQLSGPIPEELGGLSSLQSLGLRGNELSGPIPEELGGLSNLQSLALNGNELSGEIPEELANLSKLWYLELSYNQLSGSIPEELGSLSNLKHLGFTNNELSGPIPVELGSLSNLQQLMLRYNQLSEPIPVELGSLSNLQQLILSYNQLSGPIPVELGSLSNLQTLWLGSNQLSGGIPAELGSLSNLERLDFHGNSALSGPLPGSLTVLTSLRTLSLDDTALCAPTDDGFQAWLQGIVTKSGVINCVGSGRGPTATHTPTPMATHTPTPTTWSHTTRLTSPDDTAGYLFGFSVFASADNIAVGAPVWETASGPGTVYVFSDPFEDMFSGDDTAVLSPPDSDVGEFGWSVSLTSDGLAVGAPGFWRGTGEAYVYTKPPDGWVSTSEAAKLTSPRGEADKYFGYSVSVGAETVAVGAFREDEPGSVFLFEKPGASAWQSTSDAMELTAPDTEDSSLFSWSVAVSDDMLVVGMPREDGAGVAYLYTKPPTGWASVANPIMLTSPDGRPGDMFGASVAVSGDTVVVGAAGFGEVPLPGAAYVFTKPAEGWSSTSDAAKLVPPVSDYGDWFGWSVAVSGDAVVVGAYDQYLTNAGNEAYLFTRPPGGWGTDPTTPISFSIDEPTKVGPFGVSVSVVGGMVILGASSEDGHGAVYVFEDVLDE